MTTHDKINEFNKIIGYKEKIDLLNISDKYIQHMNELTDLIISDEIFKNDVKKKNKIFKLAKIIKQKIEPIVDDYVKLQNIDKKNYNIE